MNLSAQYGLKLSGSLLTFRAGVENLFDRDYTTYSDWNGIPQKGRNVFFNAQFTF